MNNLQDDSERLAHIRAAFDLFDKDGKGCIVQEEISTVMRYLGAFPSERDIVKKVLPDMQEDEPTTFITYEKFEKKMIQVLQTGEYAPDTDDTLLAAFRVLDPDRNGYIESEVMKELLITRGTPFREKEVDVFLNAAKDMDTGKIYYEDYISMLVNELGE